MLKGLIIAIRRQRKLILIFLVTIFLPSLTLSIFGLIALHNERYRLEKQFREKQQECIDRIKSEVNRRISTLENELHLLVRMPSFTNRESPEINRLVADHLDKHQLTGQFFVVYEGYDPWFPPFQGEGSGYIPGRAKKFTGPQRRIMEQAENLEFTHNDYPGAITLLEEILKTTGDLDQRGHLLNLIARNHMKNNSLDKAIAVYTSIIRELPGTRTSSGIPYSITARLQLVECYLRSGHLEEALDVTFQAYEETIRDFYLLSENQFAAYASLAREHISNIREEYPDTSLPDFASEKILRDLDSLYQERINEWKAIQNLKEGCLTELSLAMHQTGDQEEEAHRYSKKIGSEDYLILSAQIPNATGTRVRGFAGIKLNNRYLEDSVLTAIIKNFGLNGDGSLRVTDLNGRLILGDLTASAGANSITSFFDDNFPPWRIDISGIQTPSFLFAGIFKSYYFWTILAMIAILIFGIVITGRIIAHERDLLRLKSDFVSSVSHEFKTPITSIKALAERLLEDTVNDPERIREYHSVIFQDAENLSHLVGNILDFSAMEEGKKQYHFEKTDFRGWLEQTVKDFFSSIPAREYTFQSSITESMVPVYMDTNAMKLAIHNLLDNAVKFSPDGSEINILLEKQGKNLLLKVIDEGIGIPPNEQARIFEKFYRGQYASDHSATGTGLGLTLVKQIVEAHGGGVRVESEPGKGSTMKVLLPLEKLPEG